MQGPLTAVCLLHPGTGSKRREGAFSFRDQHSNTAKLGEEASRLADEYKSLTESISKAEADLVELRKRRKATVKALIKARDAFDRATRIRPKKDAAIPKKPKASKAGPKSSKQPAPPKPNPA